jgi:Cys-tRNA(Pro)/Cys-tRNA(Cys) deacylase
MSATPAIAVLVKAGIRHQLHSYRHDPTNTSYGSEAARALEIDPTRMFKTLVVAVGVGHPPLAVALVPVAGRLDLKRFASTVGTKKAELADAATVVRATGYVLGGVSPLGQKTSLPTVIDQTATTWQTIYISAGKRGLDVELSCADLASLTGATIADIAV